MIIGRKTLVTTTKVNVAR